MFRRYSESFAGQLQNRASRNVFGRVFVSTSYSLEAPKKELVLVVRKLWFPGINNNVFMLYQGYAKLITMQNFI